MSMLRPMRDGLFKYRKRKKVSLDGSVPGVPYTNYSRSRKYVAGMPYRPGSSGYHHNSYMGAMPQKYHPSLNAPAVRETEYDPYESSEIFFTPRPVNPGLPHEFNNKNHEMPLSFSLPADDLTQTELLRMTMGEREESSVEDESLDHYPGVTEIADALAKLSTVLPSDHQDLLNLRTAMRDLLGFQELWPELEESGIGSGPFETEELTPEVVGRKFFDITGALGCLQEVLPPEHPDIINLRAAMHNILDDPETMSMLESLAGDDITSKLGEGNPYEIDMFGEPEPMFGEPQPNGPFVEEYALEEIVQQEGPFEAPEPEFAQVERLPDMGMPDAMPEPTEYDVGMVVDGIDHIAEQPRQMFENQDMQPEMTFGEPQPDGPFVEEHTLEEIVQQQCPFAVPAPEFMEQDMMPNEMITNMGMSSTMPQPASYDVGMAADEINQAIDQVVEQPMPQEVELDPFQQLYDPFMAQQYMFDPMMQYMPNYMIPGPMPFGPSMGPGPMGPMPMPDMMPGP